jgi:hypothetical protein
MRQRLTFDIEWAQYTPDKTMSRFAEKIRNLVMDETGLRIEPPFDHFRALVESSDTRITKE